MSAETELRWETAHDVDEIHALLCASDLHNVQPGAPAPQRNRETTIRTVRDKSVHVLRRDRRAVAMFTLTSRPSFDAGSELFPVAAKPVYLSRLAVHPEELAERSMLGLQCIRRAIEVAEAAQADAIRAEANPDLAEVWRLLLIFGFKEYGRTRSDSKVARGFVQKKLGAP